jgi:endogenous inhibitor of DNA gyrase (YacG/DUF329 family)
MKILSTIPSKNGLYKVLEGKTIRYYKQVNCEHCNKIIYKSKYHTLKYPHCFCSRRCQADFHFKASGKISPLDKQENNNFYYLLGLIVTDGHIAWPGSSKTQKGYKCNITLHKNDVKLLEEIQKMFGGQLFKRPDNTYTWTLFYGPWVEYLRDTVGLTNNKTYTLTIDKWYNTLTDSQRNYFWRGCIDGDGWIYESKNDNFVGICTASLNFAKLISVSFDVRISERTIKLKNKLSTTYNLRLAGCRNSLLKMNRTIFNIQPGDLCMHRKFDKFKRIIALKELKNSIY